jgi:acyl transferase domain-containing protein
VPLARWDADAPPLDAASSLETQARFGVFLPPGAAEAFDARALGMTPAEALLADPQQRLLLEVFQEAHAGASAAGLATGWAGDCCGLGMGSPMRPPARPQRRRTLLCSTAEKPSPTPTTDAAAAPRAAPRDAAVYVGLSQLEYPRITLTQRVPVSAFYATGAHLSVAAGRISFTWGLRGPAVAIDTACSSSLVAAHLAAGALAKGGVRLAAAGGVNLTLLPSWTMACNRAGALLGVLGAQGAGGSMW